MDRLTDLTSPNLRNRNDPSDIARPRNAQSRRDDEVEVHANERAQTRDRIDRKHDRPERFSVNVGTPPADPAASEAPAQKGEDATRPNAECAQDDSTKSARNDPRLASNPAKPATNASAPEPKLAKSTLALPESAQPAATPKDEQAAPLVAPPQAVRITPAAALASTAATPPQELPLETNVKAAKATSTADAASNDALSTGPRAVEARPNPQAAVQSAPSIARGADVETKPADVARPPSAPLPVHDVERAADILRQVRVQLAPHVHEAHIQLQPLELGRISIRISVEEGRMRTTVRAEKQEALTAIQAHLPELKAALRQQGIEAQEFQLSLGLEQRAPRDDAHKSARADKSPVNATEPHTSEHALLLRATAGASGIDLYA